ncbi:hypothetical protein [Peribacillus sp. SCS-155]|uniref:hypothetical protein n=1 Tax=Peribacillus sedimenti TaxID=3115297 RepID=UPI00390629D7
MLILWVISLFATLTIFTAGTTAGLYNNLNKISTENHPVSLMYTVPGSESGDKVNRLMKDADTVYTDQIRYTEIEGDLSPTRRWPSDYPIILIPEADFHRLAGRMDKEHDLELGINEAIVFYDGNINQATDPYTGKQIRLNSSEKVRIVKYQNYGLLNQSLGAFPMVIDDGLYAKIAEGKTAQMRIYKLNHEKSSGSLVQAVEKIVAQNPSSGQPPIFSSFYQEYQKGMQTYGILIFISSFLGLVSLLATGSMLHYKQLTEAADDRPRYEILDKIGMGRPEVRKAIAKQLLPIFMLPLVIAIGHSSILITALSRYLHINMLLPFVCSVGLYIVIYSLYYFITLTKYENVVTD